MVRFYLFLFGALQQRLVTTATRTRVVVVHGPTTMEFLPSSFDFDRNLAVGQTDADVWHSHLEFRIPTADHP
jgi:hypothetical protein